MSGGSLYLIEILHQTTTCGKCEDCLRRCILLKFYIKPQHSLSLFRWRLRCILLKFYIKPQPLEAMGVNSTSCILLKFYIKPQQFRLVFILVAVVSYWNSTSNHNCRLCRCFWSFVVSYWNSTSNHNSPAVPSWTSELYLIEILHQTTTPCGFFLLTS